MRFREKILKFSGDDPRIIRHCPAQEAFSFLTVAAAVPVVSALCLASGFITFQQVFKSSLSALFISIVFAATIANIYSLLLFTLSKDPLPQKSKPASTYSSVLIRLFFLWFIALLVAKPLETVFYKKYLDRDIVEYKQETLEENEKRIHHYYNAQTEELKQMSRDSHYLIPELSRLKKQETLRVMELTRRVQASDYYFQRIRFLQKRHPSSWLFTLLVTFLFTYPAYCKYKIRNGRYYTLKWENDRRIIEVNYYAFKRKHAAIFRSKYARDVERVETHWNPPYNTERRTDQRAFYNEEKLLTDLYEH